MLEPRERFMRIAIEQAMLARQDGDYAIGAVVARHDELVAFAGNSVKRRGDSTQHAEIVAIQEASKTLGRYLEGCVLYSTHEPCPMCSSAAVWARMSGIICGATLEDMAAYGKNNGNTQWSWRTIDIPASRVLGLGTPRLELLQGYLREECIRLFHS